MRAFGAGLVAIALAALSAGCGCPTMSGPTGPTATFSDTVNRQGQKVHDYPPPRGTTQMEVVVQWSDPDVELRLMWIDADCDPLARDDCRRFSEPVGPFSTGPATTIRVTAANQGPAAGPRMRFVVLNLSDRAAAYTMTISPRQAGCT
jgi:hypothetical protein